MILTGEHIDAAEALRIGPVSEVVPAGALDDAVSRLADTFRRVGPRAVAYATEAVTRGFDLPLSEGLRIEGELSTLLTTTRDRAEGAAAFKERRDPVYPGQ